MKRVNLPSIIPLSSSSCGLQPRVRWPCYCCWWDCVFVWNIEVHQDSRKTLKYSTFTHWCHDHTGFLSCTPVFFCISSRTTVPDSHSSETRTGKDHVRIGTLFCLCGSSPALNTDNDFVFLSVSGLTAVVNPQRPIYSCVTANTSQTGILLDTNTKWCM